MEHCANHSTQTVTDMLYDDNGNMESFYTKFVGQYNIEVWIHASNSIFEELLKGNQEFLNSMTVIDYDVVRNMPILVMLVKEKAECHYICSYPYKNDFCLLGTNDFISFMMKSFC